MNPNLEAETSELQILINLGLTLKQAKVYLALAKTGPQKTAEIAKNAKTNQADVYRALTKLEQIGLVEKVIATPLKYRAAPLAEAAARLLEAKTAQYEKVRAESRILLETARANKQASMPQLEPEYVLVPAGRAVVEKISAAIEEAERSIALVLSWERFSCGAASTFAENLEKAWSRKVNMRLVVERPSEGKTAKELIQHFSGKPFCQVRLFDGVPPAVFGVYDDEQVFVVVFPEKKLDASPVLWSNNRSLIALAKGCFEWLWQAARECRF